MSDNQIYSLAFALVNGSLLTEEVGLALQRSSGSQPVVTVHKGYAGESPGAAMVTLDIDNVVPASGFEFDAGDAIEGLVPAEIGVLVGGKVATLKGFIHEDDFKHSANSASSYSFKFRGSFKKFES